MHCKMCNIWDNPTKPSEEFKPELLKKLPRMRAVNITGGEPFVREDIVEIVEILRTKTDRIVFSTSGWFSDRIIEMAKRFPDVGYRISLEGLSCKNDELRGRQGGFDKGLGTLLELRRMGIKDIGFGITVSNNNSRDMLDLYELSKYLGMQFATASFHNSFYFHKYDNQVTNKEEVCGNFDELIQRLMKENHPKSWARAFFNLGLINYINGGRRMLPCEAGSENFFLDPFGNILPCNGMEESCWYGTMGNLNEPAGRRNPRQGGPLPQELLDDRKRLPGNEEIHQGNSPLDSEEQAQGDARRPRGHLLHPVLPRGKQRPAGPQARTCARGGG